MRFESEGDFRGLSVGEQPALLGAMGRVLQQISSVAFATVLSRVLGLIRDVLVFAALGAGAVNSAFVLAFTLPNLFRRLLGEGALTSAFVPVLTESLETSGRAAGMSTLNRLLSRLLVILLVLAAGGAVVLWGFSRSAVLSERWRYGAELSAVLFPYVCFICLAALIAAALNVLGRFFIPALTPVLLNLAMIGSLVVGLFWSDGSPTARVAWLCGGVLLGGALQLLIPVIALRRENWRPRLDFSPSPENREVWQLFLPGVLGAAIFQVNIVVSRLLAFGVNEAAAGVLYLANRLVELPLGVFAISITTVFFPALAREAGAGRREAFGTTYEQGLRLILAITLPASVGLAMLAEPILRALFEWGLFDAQDVTRTVGPLRIFALGLPFYAWTTLATRALHSWKEMKTPVKLGAINAVLNLGLSLLLLGAWAENGLAAANVLAAAVFALLLERSVRRHLGQSLSRAFYGVVVRLLLASAFMGGLAGALSWGLETFLELEPKLGALIAIVLVIPSAVGFYAIFLSLSGLPEAKAIKSLLRRRKPTVTK